MKHTYIGVGSNQLHCHLLEHLLYLLVSLGANLNMELGTDVECQLVGVLLGDLHPVDIVCFVANQRDRELCDVNLVHDLIVPLLG